jgi:general secretion pathway protein F/type IV pilus assembly protein PilC
MPDYSYEVLDRAGKRDRGILTANSEREAISQLDARGLFPVRIEASRTVAQSKAGGKKINSRALAQLFSQLADLLRAGVPLLKSMEILERQQSGKPALRDILRDVREKVAEGTNLADAFGQHPRAFNELIVSMVKAGEEGGFLEDVLERVAQFTEQQEDLKAKVVGAMAYPIFLAVAGFVVINVLVLFFVPQFEPIFEKLAEAGELPLLTQGLIGMSHLFLNNWIAVFSTIGYIAVLPFFTPADFDSVRPGYTGRRDTWAIIRCVLLVTAACMPFVLFVKQEYIIALGCVGIMVGLYYLRAWIASPDGRFTIDRWRLKMPGAGNIYLHLALSRFTRILGTMLHNGIPILQALRIAKDSTGNLVLTQAIDRAGDNLSQGDKLAVPLAACPYFPRDVVEMVAVGEETNQMEKVLLDIANALEKRTSRQLELFVRLLEPVMLLVMAGVTLVVVVGLLLPVFKMSSAVK